MFDALEMTWKHTDQADLITNLYQGTMKDYVKCLKVTATIEFQFSVLLKSLCV